MRDNDFAGAGVGVGMHHAAKARRANSFLLGACLAALGAGTAAPALAQNADDLGSLRNLSIEELSQVQITSVAKRAQPLSSAPASVFVITADDIRRSGAVSLPEVLRLAPNLQVGRVDARDYAISARGLNSFEVANKLLVLIDGRSVHSPLYSGVEWDAQHLNLPDLERIEVVSGPGGTLWGANAVNGVVNVISRSALETQGLLATANLGTRDQRALVRYGGLVGDAGAYRVYLSAFGQGPTETSADDEAGDRWQGVQAGFRSDFDIGDNAFTLQGDAFDAPLKDVFTNNERLSGGNILGRWTRTLGPDASVEVQAYYDRERRVARGVFELTSTWDVEGRYLRTLGRHQVVLGAGYRSSDDHFINRLNAFVVDPPRDTVSLANVFAQSNTALTDRLTLTAGLKFENSSYSGAEWLPNVRLAWRVTERDLLWTAVSRAIRSPSRIDRELVFPGVLVESDFQPEAVLAYEAGWRGRPASWATASVSVFYNQYDRLRSSETTTGALVLPIRLANGVEGETWGLEAWGDADVTPWWRLGAGLSLLGKEFRTSPGRMDLSSLSSAGDDPGYQLFARSQMQLSPRLDFDLNLRSIDELERDVPAYTELAARLSWRATEAVEMAVGGQNLLHESHKETAEQRSTEVPRNLYVELRWSY